MLITLWSGWIAALTLVTCVQVIAWVWFIGPTIGFCVGATWSTSRVMVIELSPKHQLAELVGLAGLFGRASSILGPLGWGLIVLDPTRYRHATAFLIGLLAIGLWLLGGVRMPHETTRYRQAV
jgi:MFS-type transporter involved in bile tolerance (Atg22 family)